MNAQIIRTVRNSHNFFVQHPNFFSQLQIKIGGKTITEIFKNMFNLLNKEKIEHENVSINAKVTKKNTSTLKKSLIKDARAIEDGINSVLQLVGRGEESVNFVLRKDFIACMSSFIISLKRFSNLIVQNPVYNTAFERLQKSFSEYQTLKKQIEEKKLLAKKEKAEFNVAVEKIKPLTMALHSFVSRYLAATDPNLYKIYMSGMRRKSLHKKNVNNNLTK